MAARTKVAKQLSIGFNQPFDLSIFEIVNSKVNLTKICKHFGKDINEWKRLPNTQRFLTAYADMGKSQIEVIKGGNDEQGTFGDRRIALKLAEWISVEFELFANEKLDELLQTGKVELTPTKQLPSSYIEALEALLESEKEKERLALENKGKDEVIESQKPAVEFQQAVNDATNLVTVGEFARILGMGEITLFRWLRANEYLMVYPVKNTPYQKYIKAGYFKVIEKVRTVTDKETGEEITRTYSQTYITGKGQVYLTKKIKGTSLMLK